MIGPKEIARIAKKYNQDAGRLLDILWEVQDLAGHIPIESTLWIAEELNISAIEVKDVISFYHFYRTSPQGKYHIYLDDSIVAEMQGRAEVKNTLEEEIWGLDDIILYDTSCIGMSDQGPAAIINNVVFPNLTPEKCRKIITGIRDGKNLTELNDPVKSNIQVYGEVLLKDRQSGAGLKKSKSLDPKEIIQIIKDSGLRGRGGAGFPTGLKWEICSNYSAEKKYLICNADEGEPGTFKDRVLLTDFPELLIEGMEIAALAVNACEAIIYLRAEYRYLLDHLEKTINKTKRYVPFRVQLGAGAYICGEESALIESLEGKRGVPRVKPPFPVEVGYKGSPTVVNNVETLCNVSPIISNGAEWFQKIGSEKSNGTKLLSVSGDCERPGIYEIPWGTTIKELLTMVKANDPHAVQVSGPSGECLSLTPENLKRQICYEDISTGGSMVLFSKKRNLLKAVDNFLEFFVRESCGTCVPCRAGNPILLESFRNKNYAHLKGWGKIIQETSRCGLGQTSPHPIISTMNNFPELYQEEK